MVKVVRSAGRPHKFGAGYVRAFKAIVRRHGLLAGLAEINKNGVVVGGKHRAVSISQPTLSNYVKRDDLGGNAVELFRGRPKAA